VPSPIVVVDVEGATVTVWPLAVTVPGSDIASAVSVMLPLPPVLRVPVDAVVVMPPLAVLVSVRLPAVVTLPVTVSAKALVKLSVPPDVVVN
jgi:hypothetical protein